MVLIAQNIIDMCSLVTSQVFARVTTASEHLAMTFQKKSMAKKFRDDN